ncbi:MAG: AI-2E family transporter, partial [Acidimicrobiales bacterium]
FTFYLVADGPRFRRTICSFLRPDRQREVLANWEIAIQKTGGYIYSRMLLGGLSAFFHYLAFVLIGVPYAIALAVNPVDALWVLGFALVYQQIENYLFAPRISARTMSLHPAVAFGAVIAGGGLFGPVGALLALPAAAVLQAIGSTYGSRHEVVESPMTVDHPRRFWIRRRGAEQESDDAEHGTGPEADPPG